MYRGLRPLRRHPGKVLIATLGVALLVVSLLLHFAYSAQEGRETDTASEGVPATFRVTHPLTEADFQTGTSVETFFAEHVYDRVEVLDNTRSRCRRLCNRSGVDGVHNYVLQTTYTSGGQLHHLCICLRGNPDRGFQNHAQRLLQNQPKADGVLKYTVKTDEYDH